MMHDDRRVSDGLHLPMTDAEMEELRKALEESVRLQSHYAELLNMYDGGKRLTFASADEWMKTGWRVRLREMPSNER